jgi:murein DD-endopeptidase MepM/ murein hydrolase activator NlpD
MKLSYPIAPFNAGFPPMTSQAFGANPDYYAKFLDAYGHPEKGHMGIDFQAIHATPVFAVHDGFAFYVGPDSHGGDGVYLRFQDEDDSTKWWTCIYWHLCPVTDPTYPPIVDTVGRTVKKGDLLGYADNTGAPFESTGDHLHFGLAPCDWDWNFSEPANGYGGCIDASPYFVVEPVTPALKLTIIASELMPTNPSQAHIILAVAGIIRAFS